VSYDSDIVLRYRRELSDAAPRAAAAETHYGDATQIDYVNFLKSSVQQHLYLQKHCRWILETCTSRGIKL
jgi:hypothetical protein